MPDKKPSKYEDALKKTLMSRTGQGFKRNLEAASLPDQQAKMSKEEAAELIFDNILKKRQEKSNEAQSTAVQAMPEESSKPSQISKSYGDILDDILWPEDQSQVPAQALEETQVAKAPKMPDYKNILKNTLVKRTGKAPVKKQQSAPTKTENLIPVFDIPEELSYDQILDDILGFNQEAQQESGSEHWDKKKQLTKTSYTQNLDSILWPQNSGKKKTIIPI